mgnify:CR=1 FL=1
MYTNELKNNVNNDTNNYKSMIHNKQIAKLPSSQRKKNLELRGLIDDEEENEKLETEKTIFNQTIKKQIDETSLETIQAQDNSQGTI